MGVETKRYAVRPARARRSGHSFDRDGAERPDRRRKRKTFTKAELRRRLRLSLARAVDEIGVVNRIDILPERKAHLEKAIAHLESVREERGGSHILRQQLAFCRDLLRDIDRGAPDARARQVEIVLGSR